MNNYYKYVGTIKGLSGFITIENFDVISKYMNIPTDNSLVVPVGEYSFDSIENFLKPTEDIKEILYEPHFKYFIMNSKSNLEAVFSKCKTVLSDKVLKNIDNLNMIIIGTELLLSVITLCIGYFSLIPLKKATDKIFFNSLNMFKYFTKSDFEQIITDYDEKIKFLSENFNLEKESEEYHNTKNNKKKTYSNKIIIIILSLFFIIFYVIISEMPILIDRFSIIKSIQLYTYEVINQDKSVFVNDEPQRILKKIQEELKSGSYGGPTFNEYPFLNDVLKEGGCFRYDGNTECFSEEVGLLPLNELIRVYLFNVKSFINSIEDTKYVNVTFSNKENIAIIYEKISNDNFFKLQDGLVNNIIGDLQYINQNIMNNTEEFLKEKSKEIIVIITVGVIVFLAIDYFVFNKMYSDKIKEMNSLVSFLFLVPSSIVNHNEKFKRFLETTQTYDY
ncbi:hypothetical protein BCR36DRAFT_370628 [Piromyces finnis]|uniref:Uncharacterized protein n=1 Tax=Piromyces finnis TaxID=1754191 RepID=A0A1Y1V8U2_9FUNG|nr:hypothetical protein BCR36DRAFT_370628 [Piromyces finnis]|eukprot:ORX49603.1 hypothetical protein BCR36DRAFT_370628 [Piromyces finnis]